MSKSRIRSDHCLAFIFSISKRFDYFIHASCVHYTFSLVMSLTVSCLLLISRKTRGWMAAEANAIPWFRRRDVENTMVTAIENNRLPSTITHHRRGHRGRPPPQGLALYCNSNPQKGPVPHCHRPVTASIRWSILIDQTPLILRTRRQTASSRTMTRFYQTVLETSQITFPELDLTVASKVWTLVKRKRSLVLVV